MTTLRSRLMIRVQLALCNVICIITPVIAAEPPRARSAGPVRLNAVGYLPSALKTATIEGESRQFLVRTLDGREVLRGTPTAVGTDKTGAEKHHHTDFSALREPGTYVLVVGPHESPPFRISQSVYNWPFYCAIRAMYLWRCGCAVHGDFGGHVFEHAACHIDDAYLDHAGGPAGKRKPSNGGWHDAGDYNKYTVNGAFTAAMMMHAWEHFPDRISKLRLDIPESSNNVPDFLDEVRWELEWLLTMQANDGRVFHKLSTLKFGSFILPEKETARRYFSPWSSAATADLVAVAAQASRIFRPFDSEFADRCLAVAEDSYAFLQANPGDQRPDLSAFTTGPYDAPDSDDRLWAAAELWEATGNARYLADLETRIQTILPGDEIDDFAIDADWDWANVRNLGLFTYLLSNRDGRNPGLVKRLRDAAIRTGDKIVKTSHGHAYARPLGDTYYWGCNGTVARQTMNLHVAQVLTGDPTYRETMLDALNYIFGRNPFGRSYVTCLGHKPPAFPHDRRSGGDMIEPPWPGYLVGGPWPTAHDWYDDQESYETNETAINWNGALIYALAAFVEPDDFEKSVIAGQQSARQPAMND
jgi:endoglucanase